MRGWRKREAQNKLPSRRVIHSPPLPPLRHFPFLREFSSTSLYRPFPVKYGRRASNTTRSCFFSVKQLDSDLIKFTFQFRWARSLSALALDAVHVARFRFVLDPRLGLISRKSHGGSCPSKNDPRNYFAFVLYLKR